MPTTDTTAMPPPTTDTEPGVYPYYRSYGYHAIGKRSADAEPAADADAYYGYYGYAVPTAMLDTEPTVPTPTLMATTPLARGPLMPSPLLMLMPTTDTTAMPVPMPTAMLDTEPMVPTPMLMATTPSARGPLMPSPLLMLMLTTDTTAMLPPMPTAMLDTDLPMPTVPTPTELDTTDTGKPSNLTKDPPKIKTSSHKQQK